MEFVIGLRLRLDRFAFVFGLVFVVASVQIVFVTVFVWNQLLFVSVSELGLELGP